MIFHLGGDEYSTLEPRIFEPRGQVCKSASLVVRFAAIKHLSHLNIEKEQCERNLSRFADVSCEFDERV